MQKIPIIKTNFLGTLFICLTFMANHTIAAAQKVTNWLDEPISISFQNKPLSEVLKQISEQTGVSIAYDQELANEKVAGNYQNVKTSDAITRLFRSKNKSIQVNNAKKIIIVKTFGAKNFIWAGAIQEILGEDKNSGPMTLTDLENMHARQYKAYRERITNENELLEGGMSRSELRSMQEQQYKDYQKRIANDNEILEGGITRGDIRDMHKLQQNASLKRMNNENEILEGGMTRRELKTMHNQQYKTSHSRIKDDTEILEGGMTRAELRNMQEQQYKNFKKRQSDPLRIIK